MVRNTYMATAEWCEAHPIHNELDARCRNAQIARGLNIVAIPRYFPELPFRATRFFVGDDGVLMGNERKRGSLSALLVCQCTTRDWGKKLIDETAQPYQPTGLPLAVLTTLDTLGAAPVLAFDVARVVFPTLTGMVTNTHIALTCGALSHLVDTGYVSMRWYYGAWFYCATAQGMAYVAASKVTA